MSTFKAFACFAFIVFSICCFGQSPVITSFLPSSGKIGSAITITGQNFNSVLSGNSVFFGTVKATVTNATSSQLVVTVPPGASQAPIRIIANGLTCSSSIVFSPVFDGGPPLTAASFAFVNSLDSIVGRETNDFKVADIDVDGKVDVVAVDRVNGYLSVYRNTGAGSSIFFSKTDYLIGGSPANVSVADVDGDGRPEIAVSNFNDNTITVFRNTSANGIIFLPTRVNLITNTQPGPIVFEDFDGDGKLDIATSCLDAVGYVSVFKNTSSLGAISFTIKLDIPVVGTLFDIATKDFDGDNKPDLVLADFGSNRLSFLRNTSNSGSISFANKIDLPTGNFPTDLAVGDVNADNKNDIIVSYFTSPSISVFKNNSTPGNFSFIIAAQLQTDTLTNNDLEIADLDGDTKPDIISKTVSGFNVFNNISSNGLINIDTLIRYQSFGLQKVQVADFNNDGKPDIATDAGVFRVIAFQNKSTGAQIFSFTPSSAAKGDTITITGMKFIGISSVSFGGVEAQSFQVLSGTRIKAVVGSGASGNLAIVNSEDRSVRSGFTFLIPPKINSFSPASATAGSIITIYGTDLNNVTEVSFGGVKATSFTVQYSNTIKAVLGQGATGDIKITTTNGTASIAGFVFRPIPVVTSFSPSSGGPGTMVIIKGKFFSDVSLVKLGGAPVSSFSIVSDTILSAVIGGGATGDVSLTNINGTGKLPGFFYNTQIAPKISSVFPLYGPAGTTVTISGSGFSSFAANNIVYFGPIKAEVVTASSTLLTVKSPQVSSNGLIRVSNLSTYLACFSTLPFTTTFSGADNSSIIDSSLFESAVEYPSLQFTDMCFFDLDYDNKIDILNSGLQIAGIKNSSKPGLISLMRPVIGTYGRGDYLSSEFVDLDGDGKVDFVYPDDSYYRIVVSLNNGDGSVVPTDNSLSAFPNKYPGPIAINDFDGDGKPDIAVYSNFYDSVSIFRNVSAPGMISFLAAKYFDLKKEALEGFYGGTNIQVRDIDGDTKPDIMIAKQHSVVVLLNESSEGNISFTTPHTILSINAGQLTDMKANDLNKDGLIDLAILMTNVNTDDINDTIFILKNSSTPGYVSFNTKVNVLYKGMLGWNLDVADIDGDSLPDIILSGSLRYGYGNSLFKNSSTIDAISFGEEKMFDPGTAYPAAGVWLQDMDGDNKLDIITRSGQGENKVKFYRNRIGESVLIFVCSPDSNTSIVANISGSAYQWQIKTGNGFTNISDNINYAGATSKVLQIKNIPASWYDNEYRCLVDGIASRVYQLKFSNTWTGGFDSAWENPLNWSCGKVPDINSDVVIKTGIVNINSNVTCHSLIVRAEANITVSNGFKLTVVK